MNKTNKKLCIIGSTPSKALAPYDDPTFDIWAISGAAYSESLGPEKVPDTEDCTWNTVHRVDAFFEMHKRPTFAPKLAELAKCGKPVIMQKVEPDIPTSERYPVDKIAETVGEDFSSTIAYMLAYAIYLGYEEIRLYGVIMAHRSEYASQRPGVKYYIGNAQARGIKFWAPDETQLCKPNFRYGYDDHDAICAQIAERKRGLDEDIEKQRKIVEAAQATLWQLKGASIDCEENMSLIKGGLV